MRTARILAATLAAATVLTAIRASHDESVGARFVLPGGVDAGNCLDHHAPCVSIRYALARAEAGNTVKVGAGIFDLSGIDPETYLHGPVHAVGGYDAADHFVESRPERVQSIVFGVDERYRNTLALRGFHWAESRAAAVRGVFSLAGGTALQQAAAAPATCTQGMAGSFPCRNLDFESQIALGAFASAPLSAANVWGFVDRNDNREYAVVGLRNGTAIVEVTDPANPRQVVTISGNPSSWREVKVYQVHDPIALRWRAYAYVTTEAANSGLQTIDMSGLPNSAVLASTNSDTSSQHTLYVSNIDYSTNVALPGATPLLYVAGSNITGGSWRAYSLANPAMPQFLSAANNGHYMHDSTSLRITDARTAQCAPGHNPCDVLVDFDVDQVEIWDVTNPVQAVFLGAATNPGNRYIHSGWPTADQRYVFFHDELEEIQFGTSTRIYTLDLANLRAPTVAISYQGGTTTTDHNGYTHGNFYYVSHYRRGVVVFDAANPNQLVEVAHFDNYLTPAANSAGTDGTWGVYPFLPSGNILVSDIENGLFVLRDHARTLDQNVGRVGFTALAANGSEAASINVRVQRVGGRAGAVTVQYATAPGTATEGTDYSASSGSLSWAAGDLADKVVAIPVTNDTVVEGAETLTLTLSAPTNGATLDGSSTLTVTIDDNDSAPVRSGGGGSTDLGLLVLLASALLAARRRRHSA
ncbi:MAG TPA: choice-of-anchor B family protein [Gammaproteobacteria bacterium]|nr:choice-of-anchor B family protein [Gammaproteobacteria bacterium]